MNSRIDPSVIRKMFCPVREDPGTLIAIVGFDASGKTTQVSALANRLRNMGQEVVETRQPSDWYRNEKIVQTFHAKGGSRERARILALFAASDRLRHIQEVIDPALGRGATVICDRYVYATFGVSVHRGVDPEFLATINSRIPKPDFSFYLKVPTEELVRRLRNRDGDAIQFEERSFERIESITQTYEEMGPLLTTIDGTKTKEEVTEALLAELSL